jgi:hypothetical protein
MPMGFWSWLLSAAGTADKSRSAQPRHQSGAQPIQPQSLDDKDLTYIELLGPGTYHGDIVGESHYQDALNAICGGKTERGHHKVVKALLVCEDSNPYDNQAVRIDIEGKTVGHLSRMNARHFREEMIAGGFAGITGVCSAEIVGGWDRGGDDTGHYGVKLDLRVSPATDEVDD